MMRYILFYYVHFEMTGDLALISTTDSEIAPFFALNHIFLPAKGKALLKHRNHLISRLV